MSQFALRMSNALAIAAMVVVFVRAQSPAENPQVVPDGLRFEVASVRPSPDSGPDSGLPPAISGAPGRFQVTRYPLVQLLASAYETRVQLIEAPEWTRRARFDIVATMPRETTRSQRNEMLQGLLEDRFGVRVRREMRSMPVMVLVRVRDDGRLGPQLKQRLDCPPVVSGPRPEPGCGSSMEGLGLLRSMGSEWDDIYTRLRPRLEYGLKTIVIDHTELSGRFDLTLEWQEGQSIRPDGQDHRPATLEGALREQLGLKLERGREDVEFLVVEQVSMPSAN